MQQAAGGRQAAQDGHEVQQFCASGPAGGGSTEGGPQPALGAASAGHFVQPGGGRPAAEAA
eukprot:11226535-Lingulodinium_polyedra.AAC.1